MRFGFDLHQHRVPEWTNFYVPYNELKICFKSIVKSSAAQDFQPDFSVLYSSVAIGIDGFKSFYEKQLKSLSAAQAKHSTNHGLRHMSSNSQDINHPSSYNEQNPCSLADSYKLIEKLHFFYRVNEQAVDRIYDKIEKRYNSPGELHRMHKSTWTKYKAQIEEQLWSLNRDLNVPSTNSRCAICSVPCEEVILPSASAAKNDNVSESDYLARTSLHYGALYGLETVCETILRHAADQGHVASHLIFSPDTRGYTPFCYAVVENHIAVAKVFLEKLIEREINGKPDDEVINKVQALLNIAIRYQLDDMVHLLGASQLYSGKGSDHEASPLYVAAEIGRDDYLQILLDNDQLQSIDDSEVLYGWSPLFIACAKGYEKAAKVLLDYGANQNIRDHNGWYAKEHAALRGHFTVAELFKPWDKTKIAGGPAGMHIAPSCTRRSPLSPNTDHVMINIGVLQNIEKVMGVDFKMSPPRNNAFTGTSPSMAMSVSVAGSTSRLIRFPILDNTIHEPLIFPMENSGGMPVMFKFLRQDSPRGEWSLMGIATTLLQNETDLFGTKRESLFRARTIPILGTESSELVGMVTFTFLVARRSTNTSTPPSIMDYVPEESIQLVGHRGYGQNTADRSYLQLGENTIESILSAAKEGASYVEFDVQLTRDLVPIIFHDFSLSESGTDVPIHDLTFEQFMNASNIQSRKERPEARKGTGKIDDGLDGRNKNRSRSRSLLEVKMQEGHSIHDRMRYTVDFKNKGFKPNTRGDFIHGPFTTLEELLTKLPDSISFDVEIKYPRLHEAVEAGVAPVALEINEFVDRILDQVFRHARGRKMILSSFTPEICILLATKQQRFPVMFITNAGKLPANDMEMRAASLQTAVRFSKRWNLAGIVFASDVFLLCPRLVGYVKQSGLVCGSYGAANNDPESVRLQHAAGLQLLMADRVGAVAKVLSEGNYAG